MDDPADTAERLRQQLKSRGLYAFEIKGDGNCMFRALSDQLYGSPSKHLELRAKTCDFIEYHKDYFKDFVDERGIDTHIRAMRQNGP